MAASTTIAGYSQARSETRAVIVPVLAPQMEDSSVALRPALGVAFEMPMTTRHRVGDSMRRSRASFYLASALRNQDDVFANDSEKISPGDFHRPRTTLYSNTRILSVSQSGDMLGLWETDRQ